MDVGHSGRCQTLQFDGNVVLVTGAGTGIGKGTAIEFAKRGAKVGINYNASAEGALDTLRLVRAAGSDGIILQADVSQRTQVSAMVDALGNHFGRVDVLVNNSAAQKNLGLMDYDESAYDLVMNVNLKGYLFCIQAVVPWMKRQGSGRIVNISSVHGKRPTDFDVVYAMTKGGIKMLTRESAIELAKYNITVNVIEPGAVNVGVKSGKPRAVVPAKTTDDEHRRRGLRKFPLGRVGAPSDIGYLACFLASEGGAFITGSAIRADGGSMLL